MGCLCCFWNNSWIDGFTLEACFNRLFELADNKLTTVANMHFLGWEVNGEAWKWRRRLFVWEEDLVRECADRLSHVVLHVGVADR
jgi:hypothetical protein